MQHAGMWMDPNDTRMKWKQHTEKRKRIAAHWSQDSFFEHLDVSHPREPRVVKWITRFLCTSEWSHVVIKVASYVALSPVKLAADSAASTVMVNQPSVGAWELDPSLVEATLVGGSNAENIAIDFERAVAAYLPLTVCVRQLDESTYFAAENLF